MFLLSPAPTFLITLFSFSAFHSQADASPVTVPVENTTFLGVYNETLGIDIFRGISYGVAERFRRVVAPSYKQDTFINATQFGVACAQIFADSLANYGEYGVGEDCTTLDIYRPHGTNNDANLPVMIWIYGGGLTQGSSSVYSGTGIVAGSVQIGLPVITVVINYRLALWGFLGGKEAQDNGALNLGLYDQRDAMIWVQNYIKYFGGDSSKVLLFGQSSGSMSISYHYLTENTTLFRAAILESGVSTSVPVLQASSSQAVYDAIVDLTGCHGTDNTFECLRTANESILSDAANTVYNEPGTYSARPWGAAIDGEIIPESPAYLTAQGKIAKLPFIIGDVQDEGTLFVQPQALNATSDFVTFLGMDYVGRDAPFMSNDTTLSKIEELYPDNPALGSPYGTGNETFFGEQFKRGAAAYADIHFHGPRRNWLDVAVEQNIPSWCYQFVQFTPTSPDWAGVYHTSEIPYVFLAIPSSDGILFDLAKQTLIYWVSFAYHLNPNFPSNPTWLQYGSSKLSLQMLANGTGMVTDNFREEQTDFLRSVADQFLESPKVPE